MIAFAVNVPLNVKRQIAEIVAFIADDDEDRALAWESRPMDALRGLGRFHGHAMDREASDRLGQTVQRLVFERAYLVHYQVDEASLAVDVKNIRHEKRLPHDGEP